MTKFIKTSSKGFIVQMSDIALSIKYTNDDQRVHPVQEIPWMKDPEDILNEVKMVRQTNYRNREVENGRQY